MPAREAPRGSLEALIPPELHYRRERLHAAAAVAAADPPILSRGDLVDDLPTLVAQAPPDATVVVFHTSLLYQVSAPRRELFFELARELADHWIANEEPDLLGCHCLPQSSDRELPNVLALDGVPLARTQNHGQATFWPTSR